MNRQLPGHTSADKLSNKEQDKEDAGDYRYCLDCTERVQLVTLGRGRQKLPKKMKRGNTKSTKYSTVTGAADVAPDLTKRQSRVTTASHPNLTRLVPNGWG